MRCPCCGSVMVLRNGPYGEFYGCSEYKNGCTCTVNLEDVDEQDNATYQHDGYSYGRCLRCGETDTLTNGLCNYCYHVWEND